MHGASPNLATLAAFDNGWVQAWKSAGFSVSGWGWLEDNPTGEADLAISICRRYGLDGFIANAEHPYEGPPNYWKTPSFLQRFRSVAPHAPLALSYIGDGFPHRDMPLWQWEAAGAAMMPQCYWATEATSILPSVQAALRAGTEPARLVYTLGTSGFQSPYSPWSYVDELNALARVGASFNVWLLESTDDDTLRTLSHVRR